MPRDDKDFRDACMVARVSLRREQEADMAKLEEAIHRAKLLTNASPELVEAVFAQAGGSHG